DLDFKVVMVYLTVHFSCPFTFRLRSHPTSVHRHFYDPDSDIGPCVLVGFLSRWKNLLAALASTCQHLGHNSGFGVARGDVLPETAGRQPPAAEGGRSFTASQHDHTPTSFRKR